MGQTEDTVQSFNPMAGDLSLLHLQAELARIDVLVRREVRRWQQAGQDAADDFRGMYVSDAEVNALLSRPLGVSWGQTAPIDAQEMHAWDEAQMRAARQAQSLVEPLQGEEQMPRLRQLAMTFGLDPFDVDTLLICLAPTLDLRYEHLYGYLQDNVNRRRPGVNLVLNLLCEPGVGRLLSLWHFADDAALFKYHILERVLEPGPAKPPLLSQTLAVDEGIVGWLLGRYQPQAELLTHVTLSRPQSNQEDNLLTAHVQHHLERAIAERALVVFYGPDQMSQHSAARLLAARTGRSLLAVDMAALTNGGLTPVRALRLALRDAYLTAAIPCLTGWDTCLTDGAAASDVMAELCNYPDLAIVAGQAPWRASGITRGRKLVWIEFPIPDYSQRCALWSHFLSPMSANTNLEVTALANQFLLTAGQIRDAVTSAQDLAAQRGSPLESDDLFVAARTHSNSHLASLARKIVPRYGWEDIVLPSDQLTILREIIATVHGRSLVLDKWGVGQKLTASDGVTVLFAGPPGTGKTMAAEIIAAELGLDLYKIDLSTIVSKYIGETEKNLERIFNEATSSNAILFFDEADALFGKRSEVRDSHDRYANIEVSYLLQRMEAYDGVTILATNLRANLDEAFTRRLQFAVDFPFPEEDDRLRIWQALFPPTVPRANLDLVLLARRYKLAGGNIRNVIVSAAFLAATDGGQVTMDHLLHGTRRELQKMGRLIVERDLTLGQELEG